MNVYIAEKPSVARSIAAVLGANNRKDGYLEGNGCTVTWAFGHLVGLAMPEQYGIAGFQRENLPILPTEFKLIPRQIKDGKEYKNDPGVMKQLKIIKELFDKCDRITVCTDSGREGEAIFRYIYHYLKCTKPFDRLWISSLTDKAISEGLRNLRPGSDYDNLYLSAKARSEADWAVGINASSALSITAGYGVWSLGRVQTPTLAMICSRYLENKDFTPQTYWQHKLNIYRNNNKLSILSDDKYDKFTDADSEGEQIYNSGTAFVKSIDRKTVRQSPPLLYDLTALQKEANSKHSFSADKTLSIAQKLYESAVITYPRTGSRYISEDVFETIPTLLQKIHEHEKYGEHLKGLQSLNRNSVNDSKVTDHHAIIVTGKETNSFSADEQIIYDMVLSRMAEAFSDVCIKEQITVKFEAREKLFIAKGSVMKSPGWRAVHNTYQDEQDNGENDNQLIPVESEGEEWKIDSLENLEKQTKPKSLHTEATLLGAMETCGKELTDEAEREALKDSGIGTPATRASIIETLFSRDYIVREKKSLVPTGKGLIVYMAVRDKKIANVSMTGEWEKALNKIATGEMNADTFHRGIEVYASQITSELLESKIEGGANKRENTPCPKCKNGQVTIYQKVAKCGNEDCGLIIFRNKSSKELTEGQIKDLLTKGKTGVIKGFKSKENKSFDAAIAFDSDYKVTFVFDSSKKKKNNRK